MLTPAHLAVLDDEPDVTALIAGYLGSHGFRVSPVHDGAALFALFQQDPAALVLLDLGLPGEDGFAIARRLREHWHCGLIIVSGRGESIDKVVGLEVGADDYVTKPFDLRELLARVKAVLRRMEERAPAASVSVEPVAPESWQFLGWLLDVPARRLCAPGGREVVLTSGEFDLLKTLLEHAGRVLSRDFLLEATRGREAGPFDRTIDVQIGRLRKKIEVDPENPQIIKSVRGAGYVFVAAAKPA